MKIKAYFGESGITQTSANTVANLAKEYYTSIESKLKNLSAFNCDTQLLSSNSVVRTCIGDTIDTFNRIKEDLREIAECKALCAYLRTAIKERENLFREIDSIELPHEEFKLPRRESVITEDDIKATWPIKDLEHYLTLEAKCATFGQYIHEKGSFNLLRKDYAVKTQKSCEVSDSGRDTIVKVFSPTINQVELDKVFFTLQSEHRDAESELNGIKHSMQVAIEKDAAEKLAKFKNAYEEYSAKQIAYTHAVEAEKVRLTEEYQKLKIVIPDRLKSIYNKITHLNN